MNRVSTAILALCTALSGNEALCKTQVVVTGRNAEEVQRNAFRANGAPNCGKEIECDVGLSALKKERFPALPFPKERGYDYSV